MQTGLNHDDYVKSVRARVADLARGMISGDVPFLEGSIELASLRFEADVTSDDADFLTFVAIESDIDHLPIGRVRDHWDPAAAAALEPEIALATAWAKGIGLPACASLLARYSTT